MKRAIHGSRIAGIAACLPARTVSVDAAFCGCPAEDAAKIKAITGFTSLRYAAEGETASDLCHAAALAVLRDTGLPAEAVDALIFVSQSRDYLLPTTASILQARLGLSNETLALDVPNGCAGYIHGLFLAHLLVASGAAGHVLLLCGETNSRMINPLDRTMTVIFGDAGTATLIQADAAAHAHFNLKTDGVGFDRIIVPHGGARHPVTAASLIATEREKGNLRRELDMTMDGMAVFNFAITEVPRILAETLAEGGTTAADIDIFLLHQANALIVRQIAKKSRIVEAKAPFLAGEVGNTGPASIPLALSMAFAGGRAATLRTALLCGFGVGLNWGTAVCDLSRAAISAPVISAG